MVKRRRGREWIRQNDALLKLSDVPLHRLYAAILTSLIGEGAREVAMARTRRQAQQIIEAVIEYVRRLMAGGAVSPARDSASPGGRPTGQHGPSAPRAS